MWREKYTSNNENSNIRNGTQSDTKIIRFLLLIVTKIKRIVHT